LEESKHTNIAQGVLNDVSR